jgi:hypothetical protein
MTDAKAHATQANCSLFDDWRAIQVVLRDLRLCAVKIATVLTILIVRTVYPPSVGKESQRAEAGQR